MEEDANKEIQRDEIVALESIYGNDVVDAISENILVVEFPKIGAVPSLKIEMVLPGGYPSEAMPVVSMTSHVLDGSVMRSLESQLERMFTPGDVVGFTWLSWVQSEVEELCPGLISGEPSAGGDGGGTEAHAKTMVVTEKETVKNEKMTMEVCNSASSADKEWEGKIFHAEPLVERKSAFQAHVAAVTSLDQVQEVMDTLLSNGKIRAATHNIMAYRIELEHGTIMLQDYDDDGESAAGGRLLHLLQVMDVKNIVVVVSRWFGGILLGPSRFACINNAARNAIEQCCLVKRLDSSKEGREQTTTKKGGRRKKG